MEAIHEADLEEFVTEDIMSWNHATVAYQTTKALSRYDVEYSICPELELELVTGRAKPDISVYHRRPANRHRDIIRMTDPPVLAIEILSPKQALSDITDKTFDVLLPAGVQTVWLLIPSLRAITVYTANQPEYTVTAGLVRDAATGIEVSIDEIYAGL
jgi:Uma2 family endonuclease